MATYVVTGAAGFIGSHLSEALLQRGHSVRGIDAMTDYYARELKLANLARALESSAFDFFEEDITTSSASYLEGTDGVFHLAAQAGVRKSWSSFDTYLRDNLQATQILFDHAVASGARIVYASSSSVYGDAASYPTPESTPCAPVSPYGITKLGCEHLASAFAPAGLDAIGLRYFTVYGPRQRPDMAFTRIARALLTGEGFTIFGDGEQTRDVTFVHDAVSATIAAMERGTSGAVYNIGGGSETSLNESISMFEQVAERTLAVRRIESVRGDVQRTASETARLRADTSWEPHTDLRTGIAAHLAWAREAL